MSRRVFDADADRFWNSPRKWRGMPPTKAELEKAQAALEKAKGALTGGQSNAPEETNTADDSRKET